MEERVLGGSPEQRFRESGALGNGIFSSHLASFKGECNMLIQPKIVSQISHIGLIFLD